MRKTLAYILCYIFWIITTATMFLLFLAGREFYLKVMAFFIRDRWVGSAIDRFLFVGIAILWLAIVIYAEAYYRNGVKKGDLIQRFLYITGIELLVLFVFHNVPLALARIAYTPLEITIALAELGGAIALIFVALKKRVV
ncbi:MAG: hypothetical protein N2380_06170 [bacterium]|nr:hypothetical protein [bacterium]